MNYFNKYVDNILKAHSKLTVDHLVLGTQWYDDAYNVAASLGTPVKTAGVIAALSPQIKWSENIEGARRIVKAADSHSVVIPHVAGYPRNVLKAWRIANEEYTVSPYELL